MLKAVVVAYLALAVISIALPAAGSSGLGLGAPETLEGRWVHAYSLVAELSRLGINVTRYVGELGKALHSIKSGDYDRAEQILDRIMPELEDLYAKKDTYVFSESIVKAALSAAILSLPLLFYYLFPKLYLLLWYRLRKKWVIRE